MPDVVQILYLGEYRLCDLYQFVNPKKKVMKSLLAGVYILISLTGMFILFDSCHKKNELQLPPTITPTVNPIPYSTLVYLVTPTDKKVDFNYYDAAKTTLQKLQSWYKTQMGNNKTFVLNPVVVDTLTGLHESGWYNTNHGPEISGDDYAYYNIKYEMKQQLGSKFDTSLYTYFVYVLTSVPDETIPAGLAIGGVDHLANTSNYTIGLDAHALAHAFGLPEPAVPTSNGIMSGGISQWPNCIFTAEEKDSLNTSPFLKVQ